VNYDFLEKKLMALQNDSYIGPILSPQLVIARENSLAVAWSQEAEFGRYELQMAQRLPASSVMSSFRTIFLGSDATFTVEGLVPGQTYRFRVRLEGSVSTWSEISEFETLPGPIFTFDRFNVAPTIYLSEDYLVATYGASETWRTVLGSVPLNCGENYWEVQIEASSTAYIFIGVAAKDADLTTFLGGDEFGCNPSLSFLHLTTLIPCHSISLILVVTSFCLVYLRWGFIGDRALYHKRTKVKVYGERFGEGDTIGVTLDFARGTLSFSKVVQRRRVMSSSCLPHFLWGDFLLPEPLVAVALSVI
jgi:hypothetical protein